MASGITPPSDYSERVRLALDAIPGCSSDADRAILLSVSGPTVSRWRTGESVPTSPEPLADVVGVPVALLVYGPTDRLRVMLAARSAELLP